jgi:UDP-N-acetylglucosamine--N-acetylmuramyl-(pentapeptide) pyrophosphoryl-undecaprenol N-acetylglucosamine transferase
MYTKDKYYGMEKTIRVVLTGGVSGGHTFPLLAVADALQTLAPQCEFLFIGPKKGFGAESMMEKGIPVKLVSTGKWRRYFSMQNLWDLFRIPFGFVQSLWHLYRFFPDVVFSKGGSASVPVVLAAWLYRIPILIHDSDAVAGMANRFMARFATKIAIAYPGAREFFPAEKVALTGNPVRTQILEGQRERGYMEFSLDPSKQTLTMIGGSQGATRLNQVLLQILPQLLSEGIQVVHQAGQDNYEIILKAVSAAGIDPNHSGYVLRPFFSAQELSDVYALSDLVLSRAGAGSISELAALGKPSILVPLAGAANDEQKKNAYAIAHIGGAIVLEEANLGEHILLEEIHTLLKDPVKSQAMGEAMRAFYHPDAATHLAQGLLSLIRG